MPPRPDNTASSIKDWPAEETRARIVVALAGALASDQPEQRYAAAQVLLLRKKPLEFFREAQNAAKLRSVDAPWVPDTTPRAAEEGDTKSVKGWLRRLFSGDSHDAPKDKAREVPSAEQQHLRRLAFGAYVGLLRQVTADEEGHRVRRDAIDRIVELGLSADVGRASAIPSLSRALDGRSVSLAGYTHAVGTATAPSARAPRVIASISPSRVIDTRTLITASPFDTAAVRVAASIDGSAFWTTHTNTSDGDVNYTLLGGTSFTAAVTNRLVLRSLVVTSAQLFATASLPTGSGVYATTSLPRTAASATMALLPGFPVTASMSPYSLVVFDTDANGAIDTIFLADDRALASGGGLLCWRFTTGIWSQVGPVAGLTASLRGLTGRRNGTSYIFFATTAETRSRLVRIDVEGPTLLGIEATLATAPVSTAYRGVAFAPALHRYMPLMICSSVPGVRPGMA
jgi:hypothetical protein